MITLEIQNLNYFRDLADKFPAIARKYADQAISDSLFAIDREQKPLIPVSTSHLKNSFKASFSPFQGVFGSNLPYAYDVEYGTGPHQVEMTDEFINWCKKKGLNPRVIARSIAKKGTKANPFMEKGISMAKSKIDEYWKNALADLTAEISKI